MRIFPNFLILVNLTVLLCGCHKLDGVDDARKSFSNNSPDKVFTEESLAKLLSPGMSKTDVVRIFGKPASEIAYDQHRRRLDFAFELPPVRGPRRTIVSGVTVFLENDKVIRWSPALGSIGGDTEREPVIRVHPKRSVNSQVTSNFYFSFWLVNDGQIEGGRYIDTERFPKVGFISREPSLKIVRLKELLERREVVLNAKNEEVENLSLDIELDNEDARSLEKLTREHQGKRVLIMVGETIVMAPVMSGVISSGRLQLGWGDGTGFNEMRDKLAELLVSQ
jgi:outer membrane protein assembly factor BamE (lipoprotein component of BamABCDE complex)